MKHDTRVIKRYENRSLYDCVTSANVSIQDLKQYVIDAVPFQVVNSKTGEDLTRSYLIQIILELEGLDNPLFSKESLEQIIRFYGGPMQKWIQEYLEKSLTVMSQQQQAFNNPVNNSSTNDFIASLAKLTANNLAVWQELVANTQKK